MNIGKIIAPFIINIFVKKIKTEKETMFKRVIIRLFLSLLEELLDVNAIEATNDGSNIEIELDEKFIPRKLRGVNKEFSIVYEDSVKQVDLNFHINETVKITGTHKLKK